MISALLSSAARVRRASRCCLRSRNLTISASSLRSSAGPMTIWLKLI